MTMMMGYWRVHLAVVLAMWLCYGSLAETAIDPKCASDFQKLMGCLAYAKGESAAPSKECCSAVDEIKTSDPKCLCSIMKETHSGSDQIKSLGIQESKLLQLPSACSLKNASLSECPRLLNLAPNSKEAAIFTANSTSAPAATTTPSTSSSTSTQSNRDNGAAELIAGPIVTVVTVTVTLIVLSVFPSN